MSTINRVPAGLLGLFDTKSLGRTPATSPDSLQLGVDTRAFYLGTVGLKGASLSEAVTIPAMLAQILIPAGETWLVHTVEARMNFAAANESARFCPTIFNVERSTTAGQTTGGGFRVHLAAFDAFTYTSNGANDFQVVVAHFSEPIVCRGGLGFAVDVARVAVVGAPDVQTTVLYHQLD